jgi:hypothetical protein
VIEKRAHEGVRECRGQNHRFLALRRRRRMVGSIIDQHGLPAKRVLGNACQRFVAKMKDLTVFQAQLNISVTKHP